MLILLIDPNFNQNIVRGLRLRLPALEVSTRDQPWLPVPSESELLTEAMIENRILITHDHHCLPAQIAARIAAGERVPGVVIVSHTLDDKRAIDDLELIVTCTSEEEWENVTRHLPL